MCGAQGSSMFEVKVLFCDLVTFAFIEVCGVFV